MPLTKPARRRLVHTRQVHCLGFERDDGLWDVEARMTDVKTRDVETEYRSEGYVSAGEPFHDMWMRLTLDNRLSIHRVEAQIDASPFPHCPEIANAFKQLEGTRIGPGWHKLAKELLGGINGCTHLNELLPPLATTAVQTLWPEDREDLMEQATSVMLNSCHGWSQHGEVIRKHIPHLYIPETEPGLE
ncbi:MAG: DUF2889 domain-containing protein [Oceanospirillaceae bacterium]|uniref:DUF2889 domain-containing protein n=1 Tax=Marinobacterium litorale TaxID=404770 RepID=UPI000407E98C|nr:DUF2889 domain-containing protein [Marinobacterium litorale]MBT00729.1 DUF2889 domain-containing protein [Oceanospirillaceae bacterium]